MLINLSVNKYLMSLYFSLILLLLLLLLLIIIIIITLLSYMPSSKNKWAKLLKNLYIYMLNFLGPYLNLDTALCLYFEI